MNRFAIKPLATLLFVCLLCSPAFCQIATEPETSKSDLTTYVKVKLSADLSGLSDAQRKIIKLLIEAGEQMDDVFWMQAYGDKKQLLDSIDNAKLRKFAEVNYGPWDRLQNNKSFVEGISSKPCLLYTSPSPRDQRGSRMPSSA